MARPLHAPDEGGTTRRLLFSLLNVFQSFQSSLNVFVASHFSSQLHVFIQSISTHTIQHNASQSRCRRSQEVWPRQLSGEFIHSQDNSSGLVVNILFQDMITDAIVNVCEF
jgi:hypothetical protein